MMVSLYLALLLGLASPVQERNGEEFFEKTIRPILAENCLSCHNPIVLEGGLDLTSAAGFRKGATSGPLLSADDMERSRILEAIGYEERIKMPPDSRLDAEELASIQRWIRMGAPYPASVPGTDLAARPRDEFKDEGKNYWAFQPLRNPAPPAVDGAWPRSAIDRFLLATLQEKGLEPAPPADKPTLLRRTTYDLTGLPPTEEELRSFMKDDSPSAFEKVVERLLASPRYGEKWARHWLDVARYADSTGNDEDHRYPYAWRYRDYVIESFNEDLPYDRFILEQIAGDLLPAQDGSPVNRRGITATGFLALGPKALAQQDKKKMLYDVYDEQLDVVSKAFLGLTVTCARCHDHKFDPIPTRDYYSMVGIFARTQSFADATTHVAKLLYRPLVREEIYEVYRLHENRVRHKEAVIRHVIDQELARRNERLLPLMDVFMLAARRVYEGGEDSSTVSEETGLDQTLLEKWVAYLEPREIPRPHMVPWNEAPPDELAEVARQYRERDRARVEEWNEKIERRWEAILELRQEMTEPPPRRPEVLEGTDRFFYDVHFHKDGPLVVSDHERERVFSAQIQLLLARLGTELDALEENAPPEPDMACAVAEGEPVSQKVFLRGDYRNPGEDAPMGFLSVLRDGEHPTSHGSGRLELARWLTEPEHPLTARVMVNRIWQWHFGEGLVRTPSNFGRMGERPSHPELLDYLARRFVESGWSIKALHRRILHSSVYQMSSEVSSAAKSVDPENRWLSHFSRRRLDVEEIRDGLLAIEGALDFTMGGTLDEGFGTDLENSNARLSLDPLTIRRRTIYLPLRRANLPTLLGLFDFGDAVNSVAKRPGTTVAPQALFMMNSDFVAERARNLAESLLQSNGWNDGRRLERAYVDVLNRPPSSDELDSGEDYLNRFEERFPGPDARRDAWQSFCRILMASNEFIYLD